MSEPPWGSCPVHPDRPCVDRLLAALKDEARLNSVGEAFAYGLVTRAIGQRFALGTGIRQCDRRG